MYLNIPEYNFLLTGDLFLTFFYDAEFLRPRTISIMTATSAELNPIVCDMENVLSTVVPL